MAAHGDEAETAEAKKIIDMERMMEEDGVKCFILMAPDAGLRMNTPVSSKRENETPAVFLFVEVLRSSRSCSLERPFFPNHENFITKIQGKNTLLFCQRDLNVAIIKQLDVGKSLLIVTSPPLLLQHNPKKMTGFLSLSIPHWQTTFP